VLSHFGYLEIEKEDVTETGKWLADLRVDRPLLVGEAIRRGLFGSLTAVQATALMACMAADPERSFGDMQLSEEMLEIINKFDEIAYDVSKIEWHHGVTPSPDLNLSAGAAAEFWAQGVTWDELVRRSKAEEGDLVRLLSRTGEALRQVGNLASSKPEVGKLAREASDSVLRDPIR
jgi:ATP-dependent RNA helicase HelY